MHRKTKLMAAALASLAAAWPLAQTAAAGPAEPTVPEEIRAPQGTKLFLVAHATGVQIYDCTAVENGYAWRLVAPRADLFDSKGKHIGTHFGGPTWKLKDGSSVMARREKGVNVDPTAIDWLRLAATSTTAGADGDRLQGTSYILRINTAGGVAPGGCTAQTAGQRTEVPYSADYAFYKQRGAEGSS